MWKKIYFLLFIISPSFTEEKKWVWNDNNKENLKETSSRVAKDYLSRVPLQRYEIYEPDHFGPHRPNRPHDFRPPLDYQERPTINRPQYVNTAIRPGSHGYGQGFEPGAVLTGPVPSWDKDPNLNEFDKCKCTEKFNCPSPGISYGQCDVGKKYCCYNQQAVAQGHHGSHPGVLVGPGGSAGGYGQDVIVGPGGSTGLIGRPPHNNPGVLVGPGGPTGLIGRPPHNNPQVLVGPGGPTGISGGSYNNPGVLVGPGGPTGIIGRPPHNNPGVLVGPGGPTGIIGRPPHNNPGVLVGPGGPTGVIGRPPGYGGSYYSGNYGGYEGGFNNGGGFLGILGRTAKNTAADIKKE